ncbi:MAG: sigma-70 family RNA polymerase sigma factor [Clostridia bacterium]|nr:sigma-70 family RNA polymerase sigma factor [Clostridia bacterium]
MENKNNYKEERFDSFLNKTIILSSRTFFKKQMSISNKERTIVDDDYYSTFLQGYTVLVDAFSSIDTVLELNDALKSLTAIEQSVIFLLFEEDFSQDEASKILDICSKSVSRIKLRAIEKLKEYLKGDLNNEK